MTIQLTDIYSALRDSVRFYPAQDLPCRRPQTWRVLQSEFAAEVSTQNLGATICDKGKPYFWSRLWHERQYNPSGIVWAFPLLYCYELDGAIVDPLSGSPRFVYNVQIGVLDVLKDDKDARNCIGCNARTINEIHADTQTILQACVEYLKNTAGWSVDGAAPVWANSAFIQNGADAQRFTANRVAPGILTGSQKYNAESTFFRAERSAEKIYGTALNLRIAADSCAEIDWNFNEPDFGVLAQEAGCKNCG